MTRPTTSARDKLILSLYYDSCNPMEAKEIKVKLKLANVWVVYAALKRDRRINEKAWEVQERRITTPPTRGGVNENIHD